MVAAGIVPDLLLACPVAGSELLKRDFRLGLVTGAPVVHVLKAAAKLALLN
jgi:hypothetical protein